LLHAKTIIIRDRGQIFSLSRLIMIVFASALSGTKLNSVLYRTPYWSWLVSLTDV